MTDPQDVFHTQLPVMLNENQIRSVLHANKVIPLAVDNPHGPLGLEHHAAAVNLLSVSDVGDLSQVRCPITVPVQTWEKLTHVARQLGEQQSRRITPSDVATACVIQAMESVKHTD